MQCGRLTRGACQAFSMLPPLGIAENVDNEGGEFSCIKASQFLPPLPMTKTYTLCKNILLFKSLG